MKAITLNPLWAVLFVHGLKKNETRSRNLFGKYAGPVLVHTSAKVSPIEKELIKTEPFKSTLESLGIFDWKDLPTGKIIGQVEVVDTGKVVDDILPQVLIYSSRQVYNVCSSKELAFGDYSEGRWITFCQNHTAFKEHLPYKGQLGLWSISLEEFNSLHV